IGATPKILNSGRHDREFFKDLWRTISSGETYRGVIINRRKNGTIYYDERVITPMMDSRGNITGYIATGRDVTGRIRDQERLQHLASHDVLTGLPNRALFFERLRHALTTAKRHRRRLAVVYMDLDDFKTINDGLGHAVGDAVLRAVAKSLSAVTRIEDTAARIGGDEFVVLAEEIVNREEAAALAERLCSLSNAPLKIGEHQLHLSITAGIALFPDDAVTVKDLLIRADTAMYQAKRQNPGGFRFYDAEMAISPQERLAIGQLLPGAAERGELRLEYQPCFDLHSGTATCMEALLRWHSPELGAVPPDRFIPVAEASKTIISLGYWILEEACRQAASWPLIDGKRPGVAVNVSALQLESGGFMERLAEILERTGLPPWNLTLELTERMLIEDSAEVLRALADFAAMGVRVSIDDFGTGYSSLSYLNKFTLDSIKIDRSFISALDEGTSVPSVIEAIIKMSHAHGAKVVAEGVETEVQLELVRHLGCDLCQGFLLSKSIVAEEVVPFLKENAHGIQPWFHA
ncbi:MAG TPA: EAL domain-containing protein, partial [Acidobacteria bacterium]|nr:EAL domain-containing protein [Acidobacteriota bacterium]